MEIRTSFLKFLIIWNSLNYCIFHFFAQRETKIFKIFNIFMCEKAWYQSKAELKQ